MINKLISCFNAGMLTAALVTLFILGCCVGCSSSVGPSESYTNDSGYVQYCITGYTIYSISYNDSVNTITGDPLLWHTYRTFKLPAVITRVYADSEYIKTVIPSLDTVKINL